MSVLVKNMKMPKDCPQCPLSSWSPITDEFLGCFIVPGKRYAVLDDKEYAESTKRPDWCPLVELKPHGDLIDRNDLKKEYAMGFDCNNCVSNWKSCQYDAFYAKMDFCLMLDDAPVVIEAEGE